MRVAHIASVLVLTLVLAGCGGDDDPGPVAEPTPEASAAPAPASSAAASAMPEMTDMAASTTQPSTAVSAAPAGSTATAAAGAPVTVELAPEHGSGMTGTATLQAVDDQSFEVTIDVQGADEAAAPSAPAHIHDVTCAQYRAMTDVNEQYATVVDFLPDVFEHASSTVVAAPLAVRMTGTFSINIHDDANLETLACGDIPAAPG